MTKFTDLALDPRVLQAVSEAGYEIPTPIQAQAIPYALQGRDVLGIAQTGTGKTAAFALPILHRILENRIKPQPKTCRVLVLSPTRELSGQILDSFNHWDDIDVHFRGRTIRSGGHGFCGIGRKRLLNILQARCEELGVKLVFQTEVGPRAEFTDAEFRNVEILVIIGIFIVLMVVLGSVLLAVFVVLAVIGPSVWGDKATTSNFAKLHLRQIPSLLRRYDAITAKIDAPLDPFDVAVLNDEGLEPRWQRPQAKAPDLAVPQDCLFIFRRRECVHIALVQLRCRHI